MARPWPQYLSGSREPRCHTNNRNILSYQSHIIFAPYFPRAKAPVCVRVGDTNSTNIFIRTRSLSAVVYISLVYSCAHHASSLVHVFSKAVVFFLLLWPWYMTASVRFFLRDDRALAIVCCVCVIILSLMWTLVCTFRYVLEGASTGATHYIVCKRKKKVNSVHRGTSFLLPPLLVQCTLVLAFIFRNQITSKKKEHPPEPGLHHNMGCVCRDLRYIGGFDRHFSRRHSSRDTIFVHSRKNNQQVYTVPARP